ncbi:ABC transporter ATP-binding protein, partial [Candidatus Saccharibacteria bacterium]|nr:ABC transporter ATP-binding protein [Candidatus Saccharibacteria bacterium]
MNRDVYKHILNTYGRNFVIWVGFLAALVQTFVIRVYVVIVMAQVASSIASGDIEGAKRYTLYYLIAYIFGSVIGTVGELLSTKTENEQYGKLMLYYHKKLVNKDMSFYRDNQTGYLASVFRQYLDAAMILVRFWRGEALGTLISLTMPTIVIVVASPKVGVVAALVIMVQIVYVVWSSSKANRYREMSHEIYRKVTSEVSDEITNIVAFKSGGVEEEAYSKIANLAKQETLTFWLRRRTTALLDLPRGIITAVGISVAVYLVIIGADRNDPDSLGLIVLTLTYMFQIVRNVAALPELVASHDDLVTKLYPTLKYLDNEYEDIRDPDQAKELAISRAAIEISNIQFGYPSHSKNSSKISVFKNLNIHIEGGEQVGIVGLSGAGKSTLANLLLRFDEVQSGSIKIDGIDIRDVKQSELRGKIAYVPQEPLLFHRTIRENIAYYNESVNENEVIKAAKAAHAHEFIQRLPDGYNTTVGERGVKLSGGQKQRIAIARAILKKAPITLFDEATSALDSESEQIIQRALPQILGKQTAIVIAHRL